MEIVINKQFGGFSLSHEGVLAYAKRKGMTLHPAPSEVDLKHGRTLEDALIVHYYRVPREQYIKLEEEIRDDPNRDYRELPDDWYFSERDIPRDDPDLIAVVRELGDEANGNHATLRVIEIPDDVEWEIEEYDGQEWVAERHRTWHE